jgi:hypothetical protein
MIKLSGQIEKLSETIEAFGDKLIDIEEKKLTALELRIGEIESWKQQIMGGWKFAVAAWLVASAIIGWGVSKWFSK